MDEDHNHAVHGMDKSLEAITSMTDRNSNNLTLKYSQGGNGAATLCRPSDVGDYFEANRSVNSPAANSLKTNTGNLSSMSLHHPCEQSGVERPKNPCCVDVLLQTIAEDALKSRTNSGVLEAHDMVHEPLGPERVASEPAGGSVMTNHGEGSHGEGSHGEGSHADPSEGTLTSEGCIGVSPGDNSEVDLRQRTSVTASQEACSTTGASQVGEGSLDERRVTEDLEDSALDAESAMDHATACLTVEENGSSRLDNSGDDIESACVSNTGLDSKDLASQQCCVKSVMDVISCRKNMDASPHATIVKESQSTDVAPCRTTEDTSLRGTHKDESSSRKTTVDDHASRSRTSMNSSLCEVASERSHSADVRSSHCGASLDSSSDLTNGTAANPGSESDDGCSMPNLSTEMGRPSPAPKSDLESFEQDPPVLTPIPQQSPSRAATSLFSDEEAMDRSATPPMNMETGAEHAQHEINEMVPADDMLGPTELKIKEEIPVFSERGSSPASSVNLKYRSPRFSGKKGDGSIITGRGIKSLIETVDKKFNRGNKLIHLKLQPCSCEEGQARLANDAAAKSKRGKPDEHFHCSQCPFCTLFWRSVVRHEATKHNILRPGLKPYKCAICDYIVLQISEYGRHMQKHLGFKEQEKLDSTAKRFVTAELKKCDNIGVLIKRLEPRKEKSKCQAKTVPNKQKKIKKASASKATQILHAAKAFVPCSKLKTYEITREGKVQKYGEKMHAKKRTTLMKKVKNGVYKCDKCKFETTVFNSMQRHRIALHRLTVTSTVYNCNMCNLATTNSYDFKRHTWSVRHKENLKLAKAGKPTIKSATSHTRQGPYKSNARHVEFKMGKLSSKRKATPQDGKEGSVSEEMQETESAAVKVEQNTSSIDSEGSTPKKDKKAAGSLKGNMSSSKSATPKGISAVLPKDKSKVTTPKAKLEGNPNAKLPATPKGKSTVSPKGKSTPTPKGKAAVTTKGKSTPTPKGKAAVTTKGKSTPTPIGKTAVTTKGKSTPTPKGKAANAPKVKLTSTPKGKSTVLTKNKFTVTPNGKSPNTAKGTLATTPKGTLVTTPKGKSVTSPTGKSSVYTKGKQIVTLKVNSTAAKSTPKAKLSISPMRKFLSVKPKYKPVVSPNGAGKSVKTSTPKGQSGKACALTPVDTGEGTTVALVKSKTVRKKTASKLVKVLSEHGKSFKKRAVISSKPFPESASQLHQLPVKNGLVIKSEFGHPAKRQKTHAQGISLGTMNDSPSEEPFGQLMITEVKSISTAEHQKLDKERERPVDMDSPRDVSLGSPWDVSLGSPRDVSLGSPRDVSLGSPRDVSLGSTRDVSLGSPQDVFLGSPQVLLGESSNGYQYMSEMSPIKSTDIVSSGLKDSEIGDIIRMKTEADDSDDDDILIVDVPDSFASLADGQDSFAMTSNLFAPAPPEEHVVNVTPPRSAQASSSLAAKALPNAFGAPSMTPTENSAMEEALTSELLAELMRRRALKECKCGASFLSTGLYLLHKSCHNSDNHMRCGFCSRKAKDSYDFFSHLYDHDK